MTHETPRSTVTQAVMLAAGLGSRLGGLTAARPKCLITVAGQSIMERAVRRLEQAGVEELIIVTGHEEQMIKDYLQGLDSSVTFTFVYNPVYATTNNIYSLWLAKEKIRSDFLILESDVVFSREMIEALQQPCAASLSPMQEWMNGTVVTIDDQSAANGMYLKNDKCPDQPLFKTVNMYSFDMDTWTNVLWPRLDAAVQDGKVNDYYEMIFAEALRDGSLKMRGAVCPVDQWYEIDTPEDLEQAEQAFAKSSS